MWFLGSVCQFLTLNPSKKHKQIFWAFDRTCVDPVGQLEGFVGLTVVSLLMHKLRVLRSVDEHLVPFLLPSLRTTLLRPPLDASAGLSLDQGPYPRSGGAWRRACGCPALPDGARFPQWPCRLTRWRQQRGTSRCDGSQCSVWADFLSPFFPI